MLIEGTMLALLYAAYLYLRGNFSVFPPIPIDRDAFVAAVSGQVMLLISMPLIYLSMRAARDGSLRRMKLWLIAAAVPTFLFLVARALELHHMPFRWDDNAHGSVVWMLLAMHATLGIGGASEDLVLLAILFGKPVEMKHLCDVYSNGVYWLFSAATGVTTFALIYLDPAVLRALP
jgi:cytochrome c oxidase subunit I+III